MFRDSTRKQSSVPFGAKKESAADISTYCYNSASVLFIVLVVLDLLQLFTRQIFL
jgi:hypothetical protein